VRCHWTGSIHAPQAKQETSIVNHRDSHRQSFIPGGVQRAVQNYRCESLSEHELRFEPHSFFLLANC
jgi:hypothetical protein